MYHYINDDYKLDFEVPKSLQNLIDIAEKADADEDLGLYINYADAIDDAAKILCSKGAITREMWALVCARYTQ